MAQRPPYLPSHSGHQHVLIADDHALVCRGIRCTIEQEASADFVVVPGDASTLRDAVEQAARLYLRSLLHIVLLDVNFKQPSGEGSPLLAWEEALKQIVDTCTKASVIMISGDADAEIWKKAKLAGARGYYCKRDGVTGLLEGMRCVRRDPGFVYLSPSVSSAVDHAYGPPGHQRSTGFGLSSTEEKVLRLKCASFKRDEIAAQLGMALSTVNTHQTHIQDKFLKAHPGKERNWASICQTFHASAKRDAR